MKPQLFIGNRNYSSWSLRAYLVLRAAEIEFDEVMVLLDVESSKAELALSPNSRVPYLRSGDALIWESLAIAEWAAEENAVVWPSDRTARSHARSVASEMHAGFGALRRDMPMDIRNRLPGKGHSPEALKDIGRVTEIWREARERFGSGGPFLYGAQFGVADAMYAPVTTRLTTYGVDVDGETAEYIRAVASYPAMAEWAAAAAAEPWIIED